MEWDEATGYRLSTGKMLSGMVQQMDMRGLERRKRRLEGKAAEIAQALLHIEMEMLVLADEQRELMR
jgi:hypothetical protein